MKHISKMNTNNQIKSEFGNLKVTAPRTASRSQNMKRGPDVIWPRLLHRRSRVRAKV